jgi:AraC family transcriptional regulator, regulatory protein of adaptative response / methylated-DNA-[protein]-cysteine methyltransferase
MSLTFPEGLPIAAVRTTGIYCRSHCSARPLAKNVEFYPTVEAARAAGYRACKRCRPDEVPPVIRWGVAQTSLGPMLLAATGKGICRLSFDEGEAELRRLFPKAQLAPGDANFATLLKDAIAAIEHPATMPDLPLDVTGTPFQKRIWAALRQIPSGETRTYAQLASSIGRPNAIRAAGTANGANRVAVLIPCHRVIGSDGTLRGYAYGVDRKAALLQRERLT